MNAIAERNGYYGQYLKFSLKSWLLMTIVFASLASISPNGYLTFAALLSVPALASLLWRLDEPPVLFIAVLFQWTQASMRIFDTNIRGLTLEEDYLGWGITDAVWLSLIGVFILSLGIRVSLAGIHSDKTNDQLGEILGLSVENIWYAYLAFLVITFLAQDIVLAYGGTRQAFIALMRIKWALFYLLSIAVICGRRHYIFLIVAFLFELIIGFTSFFSNFQEVILILILAFLTFVRFFARRLVIWSIVAFLLLAFFLIIWSAVKSDYRTYLNQGTGEQIISVPFADRFEKMVELTTDIDTESFIEGVEAFARRVAYVGYFARVLENVPENIPYEEGKMWGTAIYHVLTPRLLFPDKPALSLDTIVTEKYTGYNLIAQGGFYTNVPLGYMTESYIDFGPVFMFVPILCVGLCLGWIYRFFINNSTELIYGYAIAVSVLVSARQLEISSIKLIGGLLMGFIVLALAQKFIIPRLAQFLRSIDQPV